MKQWEKETCGTCQKLKKLRPDELKTLATTIAASSTLRASDEIHRCVIDPSEAPRIAENPACSKWVSKED